MIIHPIALIALALCLYAAVTDVKRLEIDNWVSLAVAGLFVVYGVMEPVLWLAHVAVMLVVLTLGIVINRAGIMGGGDVKLLAALSLWAGLSGLPTLLMATSLAGAVVALTTLSLKHATIFTAPTGLAWVDGAKSGKPHVAYGIAIAIGAAAMLPLVGQ